MARKLNTLDFIQKAVIIHGEKYDYSLVNYNNSKKKIKIICHKHGEFQQTPNSHLNGAGCPVCSRLSITNKNRLNNENFIKKANMIHDNKYDYSKANYINSSSIITIICQRHGKFNQIAHYHLSGNGCPHCGGSVKSSTKIFIEKAKIIHNNRYNYLKVDYKNSRSKVIITCPDHGEFQQTPNKHLSGRGCPYCAGNKIPSFEHIIELSNKSHNNKYQYLKINKNRLIILCQKHGVFDQEYSVHVSGHGCPKCGVDTIRSKSTLTGIEFIDRSKYVHDNKYDYSKTNYINSRSKVKIICPNHGLFEQIAGDHLLGHGCTKCSTILDSNPILDVKNFLQDNDISFTENVRSVIKPYEIDLFIPKFNLGIEFHGLYWHSYNKKETTKQKFKHHNKASLANNNNIKLIQIFEHEWAYKQSLIKSMILSKLGLNTSKIAARKCNILNLTNMEYNKFLEDNHLQGKIGSRYKFGLCYNDNLVMVLGVNKHHKYDFELMRVATLQNHSVVGGFSKLLKHFSSQVNGKILTYCDRRYSNGDLYHKNGFKLTHVSNPNYFYLKNKKVYSRQQYQKHKLYKKLDNFNDSLSESENMFNNGFRRCWDAGHFVFIKDLN